MNIIILIGAWVHCMSKVYGQFYSYWLSSSSAHTNDFYLYPKTRMRNIKKKIATYQDINDIINECLKKCRTNTQCFSLNVIESHTTQGKYSCELFSTNDGVLQTPAKKSKFYSKYPPACARGYCEELSYLKICGACKCHSLCNSKLPHYCDCAEVVSSSTTKDCSMAIKIGDMYPLAGLYYISNIVQQTVRVMCQAFRPTVVEELWITIYRRLHDETLDFKKERGEYEDGFNQPFQDNYFMGYKKIAALTATESMTLGIAMISQHGEEKYIEYDNFKLTKSITTSFFETDYSAFRCNDCLDDFLGEDNREDCPSFDLFKDCLDEKAIRLGKFKWQSKYRDSYISSTFMLRPMKKNKVIQQSEEKVIRSEIQHGKVWGKMELCVKFDFRFINYKKYLSLLLLGKGTDYISIQYLHSSGCNKDNGKCNPYHYIQIMSAGKNKKHSNHRMDLTKGQYHSLQVSFVKANDKWFMQLKVDKKLPIKIEWFPIPNYLNQLLPISSGWSHKNVFVMKNLYVNGQFVF